MRRRRCLPSESRQARDAAYMTKRWIQIHNILKGLSFQLIVGSWSVFKCHLKSGRVTGMRLNGGNAVTLYRIL